MVGAPFNTNRQSDRPGLVEVFTSIMTQELESFSREIKTDFMIKEVCSVGSMLATK